jgi:hypothetical protein
MQEMILDLSGELGAEFEAYVRSGNTIVAAEMGCESTLSCSTLGCTFSCCLP